MGILVVVLAGLLIKTAYGPATGSQIPALVAYTVFTAALVFGVATISNDNLQDLKTGQLVGATPWKQQVALIIGVLVGSVVMAPILQLMQAGFGFQGRRAQRPTHWPPRKPRSCPRWPREYLVAR